jgi:hypothetical protein
MPRALLLLSLLGARSEQLSSGEVRSWSAADVTEWIGTLGWEEYRGTFAEARLSGKQLLQLGKKQLHDQLLVVAPDHRRAILAEIAKLEKPRRAVPTASRASAADDAQLVVVRERLIAGGLPDSPPLRTGPEHPIERWSVSDVLSWLSEIGLSQVAQTLKRFKVDGHRLAQLDSDEAIDKAVRGQIEAGHCVTLAQEVLALKACVES